MPKQKTKSGAKKRFRVRGSGSVKRSQAFKRHILTKKSTKTKRHLRGAVTAVSPLLAQLRSDLGSIRAHEVPRQLRAHARHLGLAGQTVLGELPEHGPSGILKRRIELRRHAVRLAGDRRTTAQAAKGGALRPALLRQQRADGVDENATRPHQGRPKIQQLRLERDQAAEILGAFGERLRSDVMLRVVATPPALSIASVLRKAL